MSSQLGQLSRSCCTPGVCEGDLASGAPFLHSTDTSSSSRRLDFGGVPASWPTTCRASCPSVPTRLFVGVRNCSSRLLPEASLDLQLEALPELWTLKCFVSAAASWRTNRSIRGFCVVRGGSLFSDLDLRLETACWHRLRGLPSLLLAPSLPELVPHDEPNAGHASLARRACCSIQFCPNWRHLADPTAFASWVHRDRCCARHRLAQNQPRQGGTQTQPASGCRM